jgi:hypothetical protein
MNNIGYCWKLDRQHFGAAYLVVTAEGMGLANFLEG